MHCEPSAAQTKEGGKLAKSVPLLLTMPVAVPAIHKEAKFPADGDLGYAFSHASLQTCIFFLSCSAGCSTASRNSGGLKGARLCAGAGQRGASGGPAAKQAGQSAQEGGAGGGEGEKEAPPPDNRTWLQKNWIYFLPVAFMVICASTMASRMHRASCEHCAPATPAGPVSKGT